MTETESAKRAIIAERLKEARKLAGVSQGHVAKILGLHRPSISEIEAGNRRVSADELARLAEIYDVGGAWLPWRGTRHPRRPGPSTRTCRPRTHQAQAGRPRPAAQAPCRHAQRFHPERRGRQSVTNLMRTTKPSFDRRALATQAMQAAIRNPGKGQAQPAWPDLHLRAF